MMSAAHILPLHEFVKGTRLNRSAHCFISGISNLTDSRVTRRCIWAHASEFTRMNTEHRNVLTSMLAVKLCQLIIRAVPVTLKMAYIR